MFRPSNKSDNHQKLGYGCMFGVILFMICLAIVGGCYVVNLDKKIEKQEQEKRAPMYAWHQRSVAFAEYYVLNDLRESVANESQEIAQLLDRRYHAKFVPILYSDKNYLDELIAKSTQDSTVCADSIISFMGRYIYALDTENGCAVSFDEAAQYLDNAIKNQNPDALTLKKHEETLKAKSLNLAQYRFWKHRIFGN